jgi:hypothetical protein
MGRMSEKRRQELQSSYGNDAFAPIDSNYMEKARGLSARYILFANKNRQNGYCEKCCKDVKFDTTKHREKVECPNCGIKLTVMHTWRKRKCENNVDWYVVGQTVDTNTMVLRYIKTEQNENYTKSVKECAREVYDYKHGWKYKFSYTYNYADNTFGWRLNDPYYFTEFLMGGYRRKLCCIGAESVNDIKSEVKKLDAVKYFDQIDDYYGIYVYARDNVKQLMNAPLYEKLEKVGLGDIARADYDAYWNPMKYRRAQTSLTKMLNINKAQYKLVLKYGSLKALNFIREFKKMSLQTLDYILGGGRTYEFREFNQMKLSERNIVKAIRYIDKNNINYWEYKHYVGLLQSLNYNLDDAYLYPKDFRKADKRVSREYEFMREAERKRQEEEYRKAQEKKETAIKQISEGLHKMPNLKEFLDGSNGLLVYVPESTKDLIEQGKLLHNCLSTYVDRVAEGKTLIFFVRRLNAPDAPFVAFEYVNGEVVQCRYDYNKAVDDDKIISFVDAFAKRLRENNVMYKAA